MLTIGVDWADNGDIAMYSVAKKVGNKLHIIDSGKIDEFDYSKYVASEFQLVGENGDLVKFRDKFKLEDKHE